MAHTEQLNRARLQYIVQTKKKKNGRPSKEFEFEKRETERKTEQKLWMSLRELEKSDTIKTINLQRSLKTKYMMLII